MEHEIHKESKKTHHFSGDMSKYLIIHYATEIVNKIKERLSNLRKVENKRFDIWIGMYKGKDVTVVLTNMTSGNTAIIVDQAIQQGAEYVFQLGTFGALQDNIEVGDIYLISGAVRAEGLTDAYAPMYYPAVPDSGLLYKFLKIAEKENLKIESGIVHSVNIYSPYYKTTFNQDKYSPEVYRNLNVVGVEMEVSSAYICSSTKGVKALAVLICNRNWKTQKEFMEGKKVDWKKGKDDVYKAHDKVIDCVLETVSQLD